MADVGVPVAVPHFERSHISAYQERRTLQMLHDRGELQETQLRPAGKAMIDKMVAKGEDSGSNTYRASGDPGEFALPAPG